MAAMDDEEIKALIRRTAELVGSLSSADREHEWYGLPSDLRSAAFAAAFDLLAHPQVTLSMDSTGWGEAPIAENAIGRLASVPPESV